MKPPTLPQLVTGWVALLAQFDGAATRKLVAGQALEEFARALAELGDVEEGAALAATAQAIFRAGVDESTRLPLVKKGPPPEPN